MFACICIAFIHNMSVICSFLYPCFARACMCLSMYNLLSLCVSLQFFLFLFTSFCMLVQTWKREGWREVFLLIVCMNICNFICDVSVIVCWSMGGRDKFACTFFA